MASKRQIGYKCRITAVVVLLLAGIAGLVTVSVIQDNWKTSEYSLQYGIVIDAGSSRTTIYLYQWPGDKPNDTGVVTEVTNCRVPGAGISETVVYPDNLTRTWHSVGLCVANITKAVPEDKYQSTPLFLGATAGMRLLHEKDEQKSNQILASVRSYLSSLPFQFHDAIIISGQQEGLYGWVTVNYLKGNFLEKTLWNAYVHPAGAATVGSMDLGGASTQIAFEVTKDLKGEDYLPLKLYGYPYNVYTHSFLCYGKNEMEKRVLDRIVKEAPDPLNLDNPCFPEGYNTTMKYSAIYDTECTDKPQDFDPEQEIFMRGLPDSDACARIVRTLFNFSHCSAQSCSFNGIEQPPVTGDFMAYAGFFFTTRAVLMKTGQTDLDKYNASITEFCHTNWTKLRTERKWISDRYLKTYCYSAHYVFTLLAEGYKFDKQTWSNIYFEKEVDNTSIGWSLGYMLSKSNMIPSDVKHTFPMTDPTFAGLIFLFAALTIVTVVLVCIVVVRTCF